MITHRQGGVVSEFFLIALNVNPRRRAVKFGASGRF
jgi:hypothetical protein